MKKFVRVVSLTVVSINLIGAVSPAAEFYPIDTVDVDTADFDLWPVDNLIQGPGLGFAEEVPHNKILGGADGNWVTEACGFPCDYIDTWGPPVIELDLGQDRDLSEISVWGYASTNANGVSEFSLRFATDADGSSGYGNTITYNPTFSDLPNDDISRLSFPFDQTLAARYVEFTAEDNFFEEPGDGTNGETPGGDRVGLGEIGFAIPGSEVPTLPPLEFYPIVSIESITDATDLYPSENLIQGPGVGFQDVQPYNRISGGAQGTWVTDACGFPCDYYDTEEIPVFTIDLGEDVPLSEIDVWGYASTNSNGVSEFSLRFATDADGNDGFGTSINYNPTFADVDIDDITRQAFPFDQTVTARYVEFTAEDNHFVFPGDGSEGEVPGGDRVGLGEIAFPISTAGGPMLQPGDADQDYDFDQLDLVQVQIAAKYLTGEAATWGEGDWNGGPGGTQGSPPPGDGLFDQLDIIAALNADKYLKGKYAALAGAKTAADGVNDAPTSLVYDANTGELSVDPAAGMSLTSVNVDSDSNAFVGDRPVVLSGDFDNYAGDNIFKATFGSEFGAISFGSVLPKELDEGFVLADLTVVGSLAGGGGLGEVDLIYIPVPEPSTIVLLSLAMIVLGVKMQRRGSC